MSKKKGVSISVKNAKIWKGFFESQARFRVAYGGRGSGKSFTFAIMLVLHALSKPETRILCIRALQKSIKDSSMQVVKDAIKFLKVDDFFKVGQGFIRHVNNGSEFLFSGLKYNSEAIKSTQGVNYAWIDEADTTTEKAFIDLTPTIRAKGSEIWVTFNPQQDYDYLYQRFVLNKSDIAIVLKVNYKDNPWFPDVLEEERQDCIKNYPDLYNHIWEGETLDISDACYYSEALKQLRDRKQIGAISWDSSYPVETYWDIGFSDYTSIWFLQKVGTQMRIIDFEQNNGQHPAHYATILRDKPYNYSTHYLPHDAKHVRFGMTKTISSQLMDAGLKGNFSYTPKGRGISDIQATRLFLNRCWFDEESTAEGVRMLRNYKRKYNEQRGHYEDNPIHDWASHGADAFRYLAMANINEHDIAQDYNAYDTNVNHNIEITPQIRYI